MRSTGRWVPLHSARAAWLPFGEADRQERHRRQRADDFRPDQRSHECGDAHNKGVGRQHEPALPHCREGPADAPTLGWEPVRRRSRHTETVSRSSAAVTKPAAPGGEAPSRGLPQLAIWNGPKYFPGVISGDRPDEATLIVTVRAHWVNAWFLTPTARPSFKVDGQEHECRWGEANEVRLAAGRHLVTAYFRYRRSLRRCLESAVLEVDLAANASEAARARTGVMNQTPFQWG